MQVVWAGEQGHLCIYLCSLITARLMEGEEDDESWWRLTFQNPHSEIMRAENRCLSDFSERCLVRGEALSFPDSAAL